MSEEVLVLNVSGIGDFVDSTPALAHLRQRRPQDRLVLAVAEKTLPLARACPYVDEVIGMPTRPGRGIPRVVDVPRWLRTVGPLRKRFAVVVSLYGISSGLGRLFTTWLLRWIDSPVSVGRDGAGFTLGLSEKDAPRDLLESYLSVVALVPRAGATTSAEEAWRFDATRNGNARPELWLPAEAPTNVSRWLAELIFDDLDGPLVVVALGGDRPSRRESPERAERWLLALQRELRIRPVIWGTEKDPGLPPGTELRHADARGRWDLLHAAALVSRADAVITTQSAAQHLVSVWDVPTLVLVGPADPLKHRPHLAQSPLFLLQKEVPCSPCYHHDCPLPSGEYKRCLNRITPEDIVAGFRYLMEEGRRRR